MGGLNRDPISIFNDIPCLDLPVTVSQTTYSTCVPPAPESPTAGRTSHLWMWELMYLALYLVSGETTVHF